MLADLGTRLLHRFDAERAHRLAIRAVAAGLAGRTALRPDPRLAVSAFGLDFAHPLGLAAGFDKNAEAHAGLGRLGFSFVEVGTVTPRPQTGNPRPRLFRLTADRAIVNRMGFNNDGHAAVAARLSGRDPRRIVGVNIGANRDAADRMADYAAGAATFAAHASYLAVNISSPNTPGLRDLQQGAALAVLLERTIAARDTAAAAVGRRVPLLVKVAPDLAAAEIDEIAAVLRGTAVDGLIVSNTTTARPALAAPQAAEAGGLSGPPLFRRSTAVLARFRRALPQAMPIVGVGGIDGADAAFDKIAAGATLLQLYTGFVYDGPALIPRILDGLARRLDAGGFASLAAASGSATARWAAVPLDG